MRTKNPRKRQNSKAAVAGGTSASADLIRIRRDFDGIALGHCEDSALANSQVSHGLLKRRAGADFRIER
jgi:hypothetical protein